LNKKPYEFWPLDVPSILRALKQKRQIIGGVICLQCDNIFIVGTLEDLAQISRIESQILRTIASIVVQAIAIEVDGDERDVGGIHGLNGNAIVAAIHVRVLDKIFDRVNDLFEDLAFRNACFEHS
jgi:hypothetical protein